MDKKKMQKHVDRIVDMMLAASVALLFGIVIFGLTGDKWIAAVAIIVAYSAIAYFLAKTSRP